MPSLLNNKSNNKTFNFSRRQRYNVKKIAVARMINFICCASLCKKKLLFILSHSIEKLVINISDI